jgi:hypothetical protein
VPVLAVAAVQRDERDVRACRLERSTRSGPDVDRDDVVARALERVAHARARAQRDLPLERSPPRGRRRGLIVPAGPRRSGTTGRRPRRRSRWRRPARRARRRLGARERGVQATCSRTTLPMRATPSRRSSSPTPEKFSRIAEPPRPSRYAARPGTNATCSRSARASRSVVSM